jgi:hypothetical protein
MSRLRSLAYQENGQALVEFALVLPILVLLLFGAISFGRAFNYWNDAQHITAEGARYAAVNNKPYPANAASLQAQLRGEADTAELRSGGSGADGVLTPAQVCIDFPNGTALRGDPVRVTMRFTYTWLPLIGSALGGLASTTVTATSVMRLEAVPTNYSAGCV